MSDILPAEIPSDQGVVTHLDTPFSDFMSHSFALGQDQSMLRAISNTTEDEVDKNGNSPTLSADDAQKKYGVGDLKFTQPVKDSLAQAMSEREKNRMDQEMWLNGNSSKARFLPGMAAGILGATANPVDFGSMFIPFVGEAGKGEAVGRIAMALRRGLIPAQTFDKIPASKLVASMAQAGMWQGMSEVPKMVESHLENQPMPSIGADELGQMAIAGIFHGLGEGLKWLHPDTHDAITKQHFNDFMDDKDSTAAQQYIPLDEHVIQFKALEQDRMLREEAANHPDVKSAVEMAQRDAVKEHGELPLYSALENKYTGDVRIGDAHPDIPGYENSASTPKDLEETGATWLHGFVTDKNRFVDRDEADKMTGSGGDFLTSEALKNGTSDSFWLSHDERTHFDDLKELGHTDAEAINKIREMRNDRRARMVLGRQDVQQKVEQVRQQAIDKWVEDKKQELKNPVSQQTKTTAKTQTVPPKDVEKYNGDQEHLSKSLDDDIHGLGGKTPEEQRVEREKDPITSWLDDAINKLAVDPTKLHLDPLLLKTLGAPVLRSILIATREAYKVTKDLMQAIRQAFAGHNVENPEAEKQLFSALTKGDDFHYSIQAELDKDLPFNVKPERFTAQVIGSRLQQMPAPERAILKNAGIDEFLKQFGTGPVDKTAFQKFVDSHMPQFEIRPMLNVADDNRDIPITNFRANQHQLVTKGWDFNPDGTLNRKGIVTKSTEKAYAQYLENKKLVDEIKLQDSGNKLVGNFVSRNVSVPIAFEKMENPRTIFLAAPQDVRVGSSHYSDVYPSKGKGRQPNMIAWAETHVVNMPDGRKVLHVFEEQSDVEQSFSVVQYGTMDDSGDHFDAYYIGEHGTGESQSFATKSEAQKFVDAKLDEYRDKVQPLIKDHKQILLKAATKLAMKEKLDGVVISDPRTAMLTQRHLGSIEGNEHGSAEGTTQVDDSGPRYEPPSQAGGMQQAYGQELPRLMEKITGQPGEQVDMGQKHYVDENIQNEADTEGDYRAADSEITGREAFDKHFPGSENISGKFFGTKHLDPDKPFEVFTPKQAQVKIPESIDAAVNCILEKIL